MDFCLKRNRGCVWKMGPLVHYYSAWLCISKWCFMCGTYIREILEHPRAWFFKPLWRDNGLPQMPLYVVVLQGEPLEMLSPEEHITIMVPKEGGGMVDWTNKSLFFNLFSLFFDRSRVCFSRWTLSGRVSMRSCGGGWRRLMRRDLLHGGKSLCVK